MSNSSHEVFGTVTNVKNGIIEVELSNNACNSCSCGCKSSGRRLHLKTDKIFSTGDEVILRSFRSSPLVPSFFAYGIPLIFVIISAFSAVYLLKLSELSSALLTLLSLVPAWYLAKKLSAKEQYPEILPKETVL